MNGVAIGTGSCTIACCLAALFAGPLPAAEDTGAGLDDSVSSSLLSQQTAPAVLMPESNRINSELARGRVGAAGKDGGAGQESPLPIKALRHVMATMESAGLTIASKDYSGKASSLQGNAISELDAMLAQLEKQCEQCGGGSKPPSAQTKPPAPSSRPGASPGEGASVASAAGASAAMAVDRAAVGKLIKDLWGRLPERQREELLQPLSEEFLPEYSADIEEYFRVLAESPDSSRLGGRP
jgi:hypothetical protein